LIDIHLGFSPLAVVRLKSVNMNAEQFSNGLLNGVKLFGATTPDLHPNKHLCLFCTCLFLFFAEINHPFSVLQAESRVPHTFAFFANVWVSASPHSLYLTSEIDVRSFVAPLGRGR
jgi:hypothetical protein